MHDLGNPETVSTFLDLASQVIYDATDPARRIARHGPAATIETIHLGEGSSCVSFVLYDKNREMQANPPSLPQRDRDRVLDWVAGKVRVEVRLGSAWLYDQHLQHARDWTPERIASVYTTMMERIKMPNTLHLADEVVATLPKKLIPVYYSWRAGHDLRDLYSRPTFYRHRDELLAFGIDITRPRPRLVHPETEYAGGVDLKALISGPGVAPPEWATPIPHREAA